MANIFERMLDSMRLYEEDDEMDEELDDLEEPEEEEEPVKPVRRPAKKKPFVREPEPEEEEEEEAPKPRRSHLAPLRSNRSSNMEVRLVKPTSMEDARVICDHLLAGKAILLNMEGVKDELAQRIVDFTAGACYSVEGNLQKISGFIFIITPSNVELSGDFQNILNASRETTASYRSYNER